MKNRLFVYCLLLVTASVLMWFNVDNIIFSSFPSTGFFPIPGFAAKNDLNFHKKTNSSKWIVVTSIQQPTEDVKKLASQKGWTVVVVADKKTPTNWSHPGVHFLSIEDQELFGAFANLLPFNSYTRKNFGYLYAILNGAEWIYDTDDDNKPYRIGLDQFDYGDTVSGLRYTPKSQDIGEKLFNPYQFYGFKEMWPRGFPLEYLKEHTNGKDRMLLCRNMKTAAVQQGVVHNDPDVDAIYRLENADKMNGLHVTFNQMAPTITLEEGTYSPWNSQNTLFHYRAFFTMFLPTTVAFRVTDIWRSYFAQKLLHLIGEEIAFYPVNAVQFRNVHDYLKDFEQEIDVYEKSGNIVEFLDSWSCNNETIDECTLELAQAFSENGFWGQEDADLVKAWIQILKDIYYVFPAMKFATFHTAYKVNLTEKYSNCREANLDLGTTEYSKNGEKDFSRAKAAVTAYQEILDWCDEAEENATGMYLPSPKTFSVALERGVLKQRQSNVLVLINNYPWTSIIGLLQRMYSPFFGTVIFCGTWNPNNFTNETLKIIEPINFINISAEEMDRGYQYSYCYAKVRDLRLQNVKGYFFIADDTIFNFWHDTKQNKIINPSHTHNNVLWWRQFAVQNLTRLLDTKYKDDVKVQGLLREVETKLLAKGRNTTAFQFLSAFQGRIPSDFMFIPAHELDYFSDLTELLNEAQYFVENAIQLILNTLDYSKVFFYYDWMMDHHRGIRFYNFQPKEVGYHPLKLKVTEEDPDQRSQFCKHVIPHFVNEIFHKTRIKVRRLRKPSTPRPPTSPMPTPELIYYYTSGSFIFRIDKNTTLPPWLNISSSHFERAFV